MGKPRARRCPKCQEVMTPVATKDPTLFRCALCGVALRIKSSKRTESPEKSAPPTGDASLAMAPSSANVVSVAPSAEIDSSPTSPGGDSQLSSPGGDSQLSSPGGDSVGTAAAASGSVAASAEGPTGSPAPRSNGLVLAVVALSCLLGVTLIAATGLGVFLMMRQPTEIAREQPGADDAPAAPSPMPELPDKSPMERLRELLAAAKEELSRKEESVRIAIGAAQDAYVELGELTRERMTKSLDAIDLDELLESEEREKPANLDEAASLSWELGQVNDRLGKVEALAKKVANDKDRVRKINEGLAEFSKSDYVVVNRNDAVGLKRDEQGYEVLVADPQWASLAYLQTVNRQAPMTIDPALVDRLRNETELRGAAVDEIEEQLSIGKNHLKSEDAPKLTFASVYDEANQRRRFGAVQAVDNRAITLRAFEPKPLKIAIDDVRMNDSWLGTDKQRLRDADLLDYFLMRSVEAMDDGPDGPQSLMVVVNVAGNPRVCVPMLPDGQGGNASLGEAAQLLRTECEKKLSGLGVNVKSMRVLDQFEQVVDAHTNHLKEFIEPFARAYFMRYTGVMFPKGFLKTAKDRTVEELSNEIMKRRAALWFGLSHVLIIDVREPFDLGYYHLTAALIDSGTNRVVFTDSGDRGEFIPPSYLFRQDGKLAIVNRREVDLGSRTIEARPLLVPGVLAKLKPGPMPRLVVAHNTPDGPAFRPLFSRHVQSIDAKVAGEIRNVVNPALQFTNDAPFDQLRYAVYEIARRMLPPAGAIAQLDEGTGRLSIGRLHGVDTSAGSNAFFRAYRLGEDGTLAQLPVFLDIKQVHESSTDVNVIHSGFSPFMSEDSRKATTPKVGDLVMLQDRSDRRPVLYLHTVYNRQPAREALRAHHINPDSRNSLARQRIERLCEECQFRLRSEMANAFEALGIDVLDAALVDGRESTHELLISMDLSRHGNPKRPGFDASFHVMRKRAGRPTSVNRSDGDGAVRVPFLRFEKVAY
ncbi:hypothetical protein Pan216_15500 [Planctomycetes bacterium Pan216]|uniref:Uncharacterized protein n=1 Tax=Kolteria novifilia TaxID=2527975 RepID=A0A518B149_9BACT|nr:hypothetical protein Pan216_15500 [Planctomycetes bacterium Pan216]